MKKQESDLKTVTRINPPPKRADFDRYQNFVQDNLKLLMEISPNFEILGSLFSLIVYWFPFSVTCPVVLLHINDVGSPPP